MRRRNFITAIGTLSAGAGIAMGTGAFTTTSAQRSFTVSTANDDQGLLSLRIGSGGEADAIVNNTSTNNVVSFEFTNINRNAYTAFDSLLEVTNLGTQNDLAISELTFTPVDGDGDEVNSADSPVKVYLPGTDPMEEDTFTLNGLENTITDFDGDSSLGTGDSVQVGFVIDTTVADHSTIENIQNVIIFAKTPESAAQ